MADMAIPILYSRYMQTRNKQGKFARNKSKDTLVILFTAFIMLSVAYYAHNAQGAPRDYDKGNTERNQFNLGDDGGNDENDEVNERICVRSGNTTFCAPSESELIRGIQLDARYTQRDNERDLGRTYGDDTADTIKQGDNRTIRRRDKVSSYQRKSYNESIAQIVRQEARAQGYDDVGLALDIIDCESVWNPKATNNRGNTPSYSTDLGLWQYNDYWQRKNLSKECMLDVECSTRQAIKDLRAGKAHQWACYKIVR